MFWERSDPRVKLLLEQAKAQIAVQLRRRDILCILEWNQFKADDRGNLARAVGLALAKKYKCQVVRWRKYEYGLSFDGPRGYRRGTPKLVTHWAERQLPAAIHHIKTIHNSRDFQIDIRGFSFPTAPTRSLMKRAAKEFCTALEDCRQCEASLAYFGATRWTISVHMKARPPCRRDV
jgi:hypothetical protein